MPSLAGVLLTGTQHHTQFHETTTRIETETLPFIPLSNLCMLIMSKALFKSAGRWKFACLKLSPCFLLCSYLSDVQHLLLRSKVLSPFCHVWAQIEISCA